MESFLSQGAYGGYVWSSYGFSIIGLGALAAWIAWSYFKAKARLARSQNQSP